MRRKKTNDDKAGRADERFNTSSPELAEGMDKYKYCHGIRCANYKSSYLIVIFNRRFFILSTRWILQRVMALL